MTRVVAALYDDFESAQDATRELIDSGFNRTDISLAANDAGGEYARAVREAKADVISDASMTGVGAGALLGGLGGLVVGLGALMIPGVGPIIAAGPLVNALVGAGVGAGVGALAGGLIGALVEMGIPKEEAEYYAEGVRRGGTLMTVKVADELVSRVKDILDRHDPANIDERVSEWRSSGWSGFEPTTSPADTDYDLSEADDYKYYAADFRRHYTTTYPNSDYTFDQYAQAYRYGYDLAYHAPYSSRDWLEIEPDIRRSWEDRNQGTWEQFKDAIRYSWERVKASVDFDDDESYFYEDRYRRHYDIYLANSGYPYDQYLPAYSYGHDLAYNPRYSSRSWTEVEPEARLYWEENYDVPWERFKDAVRHGWEEVKEAVGVR